MRLLGALLCLLHVVDSQYSPFGNVQSEAQTKSLSGGLASEGDPKVNAAAMELLTVGLLGGYAERKVKQFNDRIYLNKFLRSYWLGTRYYSLDNHYFLDSRDTCAYRMNATERVGLEYEDGTQIWHVIYQCQKYAEFCCGLTCCKNSDRRAAMPSEEKNFASMPSLPLLAFPLFTVLRLLLR
uniref:CX domain-containing protein n=1 Tax=Steinernema glaseri TaxID=37863 RepID=A0A1I7YYL7_9BILA